jgi:KDO2-lipid IV(A) lauroyltransferase
LTNSFPNKSEKEIHQICKSFYKHLADVFYETAKGMTANPERLCKRYKILNPEIADKYAAKNQNILFLASHYGNWEWGIQCFNILLKHQIISLYLPLNNKYSEKYGIKKRTRTGMRMVPVQKTRDAFKENSDNPFAIIMAADQTPSNMEKSHWIKFLGQDTPCIHGPEAYGRKLSYPQIFVDVRKPKRGYYEITLKEIPFDPSQEPKGSLTCKYMKELENVILETPDFWLWSHRRWKRSIPDNINEIRITCK